MAIEHHFKANTERVFSLLTNADYLVQRSLALGELSADCTVEDDGEQVVITLMREVERAMPAFLAPLFHNDQTLEIVERWSIRGATRLGHAVLTVRGQPVTIESDLKLHAESASECRYSVNFTVRAEIPLIGRRVESFFLGQTEATARAELEYLASVLG